MNNEDLFIDEDEPVDYELDEIMDEEYVESSANKILKAQLVFLLHLHQVTTIVKSDRYFYNIEKIVAKLPNLRRIEIGDFLMGNKEMLPQNLEPFEALPVHIEDLYDSASYYEGYAGNSLVAVLRSGGKHYQATGQHRRLRLDLDYVGMEELNFGLFASGLVGISSLRLRLFDPHAMFNVGPLLDHMCNLEELSLDLNTYMGFHSFMLPDKLGSLKKLSIKRMVFSEGRKIIDWFKCNRTIKVLKLNSI